MHAPCRPAPSPFSATGPITYLGASRVGSKPPDQLDNPRASFETAASRLPQSKKSAFPAKAGIHLSGDGVVEKWIPAFAGNADFRLITPSLNELDFDIKGDSTRQR